ncbi:glycosyltransferase family 4 protein [Candidatus Bathyarchaeota archaeon]|nr:glycosyltransferase family 4 protein [Candidatus Bathyarchaeota archaeon]
MMGSQKGIGKSRRVCLVIFPFGKGTVSSNIIRIFERLSDDVFLITAEIPQNRSFSNKVHVINIKSHTAKSLPAKILKEVMTELKISAALIKIIKKVDVVFFAVGGTALFFPVLSTLLLRRKIMIGVMSSASEVAKTLYGRASSFLSKLLRVLECINYMLANQVIVESESVVQFHRLEKWKYKISIGGFFVDINRFEVKKGLWERENLIGYFGYLGNTKGVMNLVHAIPLIFKEENTVRFLIAGDGPLFQEIVEKVKDYQGEVVSLKKWIPDERFVDSLNEVKLLVLPSLTEGLPNLVLEAMACGTPVLATPVGGIPDVIKDGETGFILEDDSPECIAKNVIRVLNYPDLNRIVKNAKKLIEKEYTYKDAVERYRRILASI